MANTTLVEMDVLLKLKDELPEEEKDGNLGRVINYVLEVVQSGWAFRKAQQNLGALQTLGQQIEKVESMLRKDVESLADSGKQAILETLEWQKKNCTEELKTHYYEQLDLSLDEFYEHVAQDKIIDIEKAKEKILDGMRSHRQIQSEKMITDMVKGSVVVAIFQFVKIYCGWQKISAASNVLKNPHLFTVIKKNLENMEKMVTELLELSQTNPKDSTIGRKMMRINTLFTTTLGKISELKVNINGHIQSLDLLAHYSVADGFVNLATAGTHGYQLWNAWPNLSSVTTKVAGVLSVAAFSGLAFFNFRNYYLSKEKLEDLRKCMNEAVYLQELLQDLHNQAAQATDEI